MKHVKRVFETDDPTTVNLLLEADWRLLAVTSGSTSILYCLGLHYR